MNISVEAMLAFVGMHPASRYSDRVLKGVKLLNKRRPGWRSEIDKEVLDLASAEACILGQAFKAEDFYDGGLDALGLHTTRAAAEHGFTLSNDMGDDLANKEWSKLQETWLAAINPNFRGFYTIKR